MALKSCMSENHSRPSCQRGPSGKQRVSSRGFVACAISDVNHRCSSPAKSAVRDDMAWALREETRIPDGWENHRSVERKTI